MYSWIFRKLPGSRVMKYVQVAAIVILLVIVLFSFVFPWLDSVIYPEPVTGL